MIVELLSAAAALFFLILLVVLAMRIYLAVRKAILDRRIEALLRRYEGARRYDSEYISYSTRTQVTQTEAIGEKEPPGEIVLELDLTKQD